MFAAHNMVMTVRSFAPFNEENVNRTNQAVPAGAFGCWVTLIGGEQLGKTASQMQLSATVAVAEPGSSAYLSPLRPWVPPIRLRGALVEQPRALTAPRQPLHPEV